MAKRLVVNTFGELTNIPGLQEILPKEFAVAEDLKKLGVLETLLVKDGAKGAILVFTETDEAKVREYLQRLPLHTYFDRVEYTLTDKSF
ncbi:MULTISPECIES: hypothetical protein [Prevotellaceae]|uniref:hypothetical protein n=1 Tax=Prevotellaceae TaxID=171552 RepID=UPI0003D36968|nr:hypothetical protein [Prevotella phocaeensis]ETD18287.1 hypothetical protein HMPREF1199_01098 [Hoylesella oralis CC98A]